MSEQIKSVTVITSQGVNKFELGGFVEGEKIDKIIIEGLRFTGDPYDHYCGYNSTGKMLFSVNCLAPCEVIYF